MSVYVLNSLLKFADDTEVFRVVSDVGDVNKLLTDLKNLCKWSGDWLMLFNVVKCKVMHIGNSDGKAKYEMNGKLLEEVIEERDFGFIMQNDMKCNSQCIKTKSRFN